MKAEILELENNESQLQFSKSPMNYIGNKYKLLPQIVPLFPDKIKTFVDLFCGGCDVVTNVIAKNKKANDINKPIIALYKKLQKHTVDYIIDYIDFTINKWKLDIENLDNFIKFRNYYNKTKNPLDLYVLSRFSYNYQIRFNSSGDYNTAFGYKKSNFNEVNRQHLIDFIKRIKNIKFSSEEFSNYNLEDLDENDFVYLDPPYLLGSPQDNYRYKMQTSWNLEKDKKLFQIMKNLDDRKVKFALSNVIRHKNMVHEELKHFVNNNKFNIIKLNYNYHNASSNLKREYKITVTEEVLVTNY